MATVNIVVLTSMIVFGYSLDFCHVSLTPPSRVGKVGGFYTFLCQGWTSDDNVTVQWYINGKRDTNNPYNVEYYEDDLFTSIEFTNASLLLHNISLVCSVTYPSGCVCQSGDAVLLIQGIPPKVSNLMVHAKHFCHGRPSICITWNESQTLDVAHTTVDVYYQLQLFHTSSGIIIDQNLNETQYTAHLNETEIDIINLTCNPLQVRVTPFNSVGYGNSCSVEKYPLNKEITRINSISSHYIDDEHISYSIVMNPVICGMDNITLVNTKNISNSMMILTDISVINNNCNESLVTMIAPIKLNKFYNATYYLANGGGTTSISNIISTYDIQQASVTGNPSILNIAYMNNSKAQGALLISVDYETPPIYRTISKEDSVNYELPSIFKGYNLCIYDIESTGELNQGENCPASYVSVRGHKETENRLPIFNAASFCSSELNGFVLTVICPCESSNKGYQLLGWQQNDSCRTLLINSSHCTHENISLQIEMKAAGLHHVTLFPVKKKGFVNFEDILYLGNWTTTNITWTTANMNVTTTPSGNTETIIIAGTVAAILLCIIITLYLFIPPLIFVCCYKPRRKKREQINEDGVELQGKQKKCEQINEDGVEL